MTFDSTRQFLDDFRTLVNMDSASGYRDGIRSVAEFFENRFSALGMNAQILYPGNGTVPCLQAVRGGPPYDIMCLGHMDTVFPRGEAGRRKFEIKGTQAFGPGVCDMKGGLLVVLHAMETLKAAGALDNLSICVAFNGDEETGSQASREWITETAQNSHRVLVFEPCRPGYKLVTRRKGGGWFHIKVQGQEAHAGADPEKGVNAVVEMAHQVLAVDRLNNPEMGTSAQVTVIHGGDKINIIPNEARASVDVRIQKPGEGKRVEAFFKDLPGTPVLQGSRISISGRIDRPPLDLTPESRAVRDLLIAKAGELGVDMGTISTGGCSDGNITASAGVPTIDGLGLVGGNSHRPDEYVELDSIPVMVNLLVRTCLELA